MRRYFKRISLIPNLRNPVFTVLTDFHRSTLISNNGKHYSVVILTFVGYPGPWSRARVFLSSLIPRRCQWVAANTEKLEEKEGYLCNAKFRLRRHQSRDLISPVSAEFVLLHSFAHILINQLIYDSGYGSAFPQGALLFLTQNTQSDEWRTHIHGCR